MYWWIPNHVGLHVIHLWCIRCIWGIWIMRSINNGITSCSINGCSSLLTIKCFLDQYYETHLVAYNVSLWCYRITNVTFCAQQGYNGILQYLLTVWSFPQITIVVIFLPISGHTATMVYSMVYSIVYSMLASMSAIISVQSACKLS